MSHSRVSLGPHCNSLHHERCGKADPGDRGGEVRPRARARPAGRASPPDFPRAPSSHFGFLPPTATSLLLSPAPGGGKLEPLPSRGFQAPRVSLLSHRGGESHRRDLVLPKQRAAGLPVAPPRGEAASRPIARALGSLAPGWRPLLALDRWRLPSFTFGSHKTWAFTCPEATGDAHAATCWAAEGN